MLVMEEKIQVILVKEVAYREAKVALRVALDVGKELLTAKDVNVLYTRKKMFL